MRPSIASRAGLLTCGYYTALFLAIGAHLPYWPVWLADWGLTEGEIGLYLGAALAVRLVANVVLSSLADRYAARRLMLAVCGATAAAVFALHLAVETRPGLFLLTLLVTVSLSPMIPLGEALGVRASVRHGFPYAEARAVGSVAFLLMNLGLGWAIARVGPDAAAWTLVACCLAAAAFGWVHPGGGAPPGGGLDTARFREGWAMFRTPALLAFAVSVACGQASHGILYSFGSIGWAERGIGAEVIGMLWATGVVAETALMLGPGAWLTARLGAARMLGIGAAAGVLRWGAMAFEPGVALLWPLQTLHALTFALAHLGAMAFVAAEVPPRLAASAQGLLIGAMSGVLMALVTLAGGQVNEAVGTGAAYVMAAGLSAASLGAAAALWRTGRGRPA